jgi:hypothetical protein
MRASHGSPFFYWNLIYLTQGATDYVCRGGSDLAARRLFQIVDQFNDEASSQIRPCGVLRVKRLIDPSVLGPHVHSLANFADEILSRYGVTDVELRFGSLNEGAYTTLLQCIRSLEPRERDSVFLIDGKDPEGPIVVPAGQEILIVRISSPQPSIGPDPPPDPPPSAA